MLWFVATALAAPSQPPLPESLDRPLPPFFRVAEDGRYPALVRADQDLETLETLGVPFVAWMLVVLLAPEALS